MKNPATRLTHQEASISMNRSLIFIVSCLMLIGAVGRADAQWARFRGPNGSGVDSSVGYPVEFSPTKNLVWKASAPYGQSSPVVVGARLYGVFEFELAFSPDERIHRQFPRFMVQRQLESLDHQSL